jgi:hypothetical protein
MSSPRPSGLVLGKYSRKQFGRYERIQALVSQLLFTIEVHTELPNLIKTRRGVSKNTRYTGGKSDLYTKVRSSPSQLLITLISFNFLMYV